jgi:dihydrofolate reductase/thymidylate synthase
MLEVIFACTKTYGIGLGSKLPWGEELKEELSLFKTKTMDSTLLVGRKTFDTLPLLLHRTVIVLSRSVQATNTIEKGIEEALTYKKPIFVIGGAEIYNEIFEKYSHLITRVHVSFVTKEYECDTFVNFDKFIDQYSVISEQNWPDFTHVVFEPKYKSGEMQYLSLLRKVQTCGNDTFGRNGKVKSLFGEKLTFHLCDEFPLLTTKKMFFRGIVEELLFFLRGETNSKRLEEKGVNIWKDNTQETNGLMGPMYGSQWRHFNAAPYGFDLQTGMYSGGYDQLAHVLACIRNDPKSRRILMTTFNPAQANLGVLYPCHSIVNQFYVDGEFLDMTCYNRSSDLFLGLPFNIASSSLLLLVIAKLTNLKARHFHLFLGDCHIYDQHNTAVSLQLSRIPKSPPQVTLTQKYFEKVEELTFENFILQNYFFYPSIKADMVK